MRAIGVSHDDLNGAERLSHLLYVFKPKIITIEAPVNYDHNQLKQAIAKYKKISTKQIFDSDVPDDLKRFMIEQVDNTGYDFLVPLQYAEETGANVYAVDMARELFPEIDFVDSYKQFVGTLYSIIAGMSYQQLKASHDAHANIFYNDPAEFNRLNGLSGEFMTDEMADRIEESLIMNDSHNEKREQHLADAIIARNPDVIIGGYAHFNDILASTVLRVNPLYQRLDLAESDIIKLSDSNKY